MNKTNQIKRGGTILGQGTHGIIYVDTADPRTVIKEFSIIGAKNCDKLANEYETQKYLRGEIRELGGDITIPECCCFEQTGALCRYKMSRIFPFPNRDHYVVVNLAIENMRTKFCHSRTAYEVGYGTLVRDYGVDVARLSHRIGRLFSYFHFVLGYDGYDCELLIGSNAEGGVSPQCYFIDFDKTQKIEWMLGAVSYRKYDETTVVEKQLDTVNRFAWYLFAAMSSMSLVPVENTHKGYFLRGYAEFVKPSNKLQHDVLQNIRQLVTDYIV